VEVFFPYSHPFSPSTLASIPAFYSPLLSPPPHLYGMIISSLPRRMVAGLLRNMQSSHFLVLSVLFFQSPSGAPPSPSERLLFPRKIRGSVLFRQVLSSPPRLMSFLIFDFTDSPILAPLLLSKSLPPKFNTELLPFPLPLQPKPSLPPRVFTFRFDSQTLGSLYYRLPREQYFFPKLGFYSSREPLSFTPPPFLRRSSRRPFLLPEAVFGLDSPRKSLPRGGPIPAQVPVQPKNPFLFQFKDSADPTPFLKLVFPVSRPPICLEPSQLAMI